MRHWLYAVSYEHYAKGAIFAKRFPTDKSTDSWELWILLISTVLGKIDDLCKNGKSYSIERHFFMEKQKKN